MIIGGVGKSNALKNISGMDAVFYFKQILKWSQQTYVFSWTKCSLDCT